MRRKVKVGPQKRRQTFICSTPCRKRIGEKDEGSKAAQLSTFVDLEMKKFFIKTDEALRGVF